MLKRVTYTFLLLTLFAALASAQKIYSKIDTQRQQAWADSVFNSLSPEERLGQLFMVAAYSNRDESHYAELDSLIEEYNIGGLNLFSGRCGKAGEFD